MAANLLLLLVVGYLMATRPRADAAPVASAVQANSPPPGVQSRTDPCDYREVLLKMNLWPLRDRHPELGASEDLDKVLRDMRESRVRVIRSMPEGEEGMRLLADTADHFKNDVIDLWIGCMSARDRLAPEIKVDPIDVLKGADEAYQRAHLKLNGDPNRHGRDAHGSFCVPYANLRQHGLSHQQALDRLVELADMD